MSGQSVLELGRSMGEQGTLLYGAAISANPRTRAGNKRRYQSSRPTQHAK